MPAPLHCPACSGARLSAEAPYASFDNHARFKNRDFGGSKRKDLCVSAEHARVCLDCGSLLLFTGRDSLKQLAGGSGGR